MYINLEDQKIRVEDIISNLLPEFILEESPLFVEFLKSYFISREAFGSDIDIIRNLLEYQRIQKLFLLVEDTTLSDDIDFFDTTITVASTEGWPQKYGLLKINDEIIGYEYKTETQFINCYRGFSGSTQLGKYNSNDNYIFKSTEASDHTSGSKVENIGILFLKEFLFYLKSKYMPGFENIDFYDGIDSNLILPRIKDFYSSKGTFNSFKILFKLLYGEDSNITLPSESTLAPSASQYINTSDLIVELKSGDINKIKGSQLLQDENVSEGINVASGSVYDFNLIKSEDLPTRSYTGIATQINNLIRITSKNHGLSTSDPVYVQFPSDGSTSRVFPEVSVINDDQFLLYSNESLNKENQSVNIETINTIRKDFYKLKVNSIEGNFVLSGKTNLISDVKVGDTEIFVDSTIGFLDSGIIEIEGDIISYTSKSVSVFKGCSSVDIFHATGSDVTSNREIYSFEDGDLSKRISMRLVDTSTNILSNKKSIFKNNTKLRVKDFGYSKPDRNINNFILNKIIDVEVSSINVAAGTITFASNHNFLEGDIVDIKYLNAFNKYGIRDRIVPGLDSVTIRIINAFTIQIVSASIPSSISNEELVVSKLNNTGKSLSNKFNELKNQSANVQRIFIDDELNNYYIAASSIPSTNFDLNSDNNSQLKTFTGNSISNTGQIGFGTDSIRFNNQNHTFRSGEKIRFLMSGSESENINQSLFVKRINDNVIKFSVSPSSSENNDFVSLSDYISQVGPGDITVSLIRDEFFNKQILDQENLRKIKTNLTEGIEYDFYKKPLIPFGILSDGVDLYPPFTEDEINFGRVEEVSVIDGGNNFDVINPPVGIFTNTSVGVGASVNLYVEGEIKEILVSNRGKSVKDTIKIKISGGNNQDVKVVPVLIDDFNFQIFSSSEGPVNLVNDTITFTSNHNFTTGDEVRYNVIGAGSSIGLESGGKLVNNSNYFIIRVDDTTIKLANTKKDSFGNNAIGLGVTFGSGDGQITSVVPNKLLERIDIENPGKFIYKSLSFSGSISEYPAGNNYNYTLKGININYDYIFYRHHGFEDGEIIQYQSTSTVIGGLVDNNYYYILKIDDDKFRLAFAGSDLDSLKKDNYNRNEHVNLLSIPIPSANFRHTFRTPEITVDVIDDYSIIKPTVVPIIRGKISHASLDSNGSGYGSQTLNLTKIPSIEIEKGSGGRIELIISNGKIVSTYIINSGSGYSSLPDLIVNPGNSKGSGAKLLPIISNGKLTDVKIINGGFNYNNTATVSIKNVGSDEDFSVELQKWRVNSIYKNLSSDGEFQNILNDYYLRPGKSESSQIVCSYPSKDLRFKLGDSINQRDTDLLASNISHPHSKILGWAFDGNPIYGQFGFSDPNSFSPTKRIKSGYRRLDDASIKSRRENSNIRPSFDNYPNGYFIEDFYYDKSFGDLDEYNGRYCITPDFPNGTYAYFTTIDSEGRPAFPYAIYGLKDKYDEFNVDFVKSRQSYIKNIIDSLITCTSPLNLNSNGFYYPFLPVINKNQNILSVADQKKSIVSKINIINPGTNYKIGDKIEIFNDGIFGKNSISEVSSLNGVSISTIRTERNEVTNLYFEINPSDIRVINNEPHNFSNRDNVRVVISGITTNDFSFLNGNYSITVKESDTTLVGDIPDSGITTHLKLTSTVKSLRISVDDFIQIDDEKMKVLRIDNELNQVKVKRSVDETSIDSHNSFTKVNILPSSFTFQTGITTTSYTQKYNKVYFNSSQVGVGTIANTEIDFVGIKTQISIKPKSIYIPDHGFKNNQKVQYNVTGVGLTVSPTDDIENDGYVLSNGTNLYVINLSKDLVGLSSTPIKVGAAYTNQNSDIGLYFESEDATIYDDDNQSLTFNPLPIGDVFELKTTVETESDHNLSKNDLVNISIAASFTDEYQLLYDRDYGYLKFPARRFNSGISSAKNTISLSNHGFRDGDRVLYSSESDAHLGPDFYNDQILYIKTFSEDIISFSKTKDDVSSNNILNITESNNNIQFYNIEHINPKIIAIKGSKIKITETSSIGIDLNFYSGNPVPINYLDTSQFIFDDDSITIDTNKIPSEIFIFGIINGNPITDGSGEDTSIKVIDSVYENFYPVTGISSTKKFNIELYDDPTNLLYNASNSNPTYTTTSKTAKGSIDKVRIINSGSSFDYPLGIASITSSTGSDAYFGYELEKSINGDDDLITINTIYNFSSDQTYRFNVDSPSIVSVRFNNKLIGVAVTDSGKNYILPPKVQILDNPEIFLLSELNGNSVNSVEVITKDNGVLTDDLVIFADFHTNGIEVLNVTVEVDNQTVNLFLKEPNNGFTEFPFEVGDKIYVEGIKNTDIDASGFNSKDYNFSPFTILSTNPIQGASRVTYKISEAGGTSATAGTFDSLPSFGRVIKLDDLVKFDAILDTSNYTPGENVFTVNGYNAVIDDNGWNPKNKTLSLRNQTGTLRIDDILIGSSSGAKSIVGQIVNQDSHLLRGSSTQSILELDSSFSELNLDTQVISDNFYYQPFSYDIASGVSLDKWESTIESLNHISGFEKFASFVVLNEVETQINSNDSDITSSIIIENKSMNLEEVYGFDYVTENTKDFVDFSFSDQINFETKQLTDSISALTNKAIFLDDISDQFTAVYDGSNGGNIVGLSSFKLTTSESGADKVSIFLKNFDSSDSSVVDIDTDTLNIPHHNFTNGEIVTYSAVGEDRISIFETDRVIGGISTTKLPSQVAISFDDINNIRLAGTSADALNGNFFDITAVGTGIQKFVSTNQNTRCLITIDGIIQTPLSFSDVNVGLAESVGIGSTTIKLVGITPIFTNSLIQIEEEIIRVDSVGFGSTNVMSVDRGFMGSVAVAHTVGASMTVREGQYIIRDDVIHFASPPQSGLSSSFTPENTGINSSFYMGMKFHGRIFNRASADENYVFDDISYQFDGSENKFELTSNKQSVEDIFSDNVGLLTGTDVSSGVILINNVFQVPGIDYDIIQNVGVGASVVFTGTNDETIPSGGSILSYKIERGYGYQELTRASGSIGFGQVVGGQITGITLTERGSGYRGDQLITINNANPGTGSTIYALVGTGNYSGNQVSISAFNYNNLTGIATITTSSAHGLVTSEIPDVIISGIVTNIHGLDTIEQFKVLDIIDSSNIEVGIGTSASTYSYTSGGTLSPGSNVGFITGFRFDNGGSNYSTTNGYPVVEIPSPNSYSNLPLIGGSGSGAKGDLIIAGVAGSVFEFELTDIGVGYNITDTLSISGIPTSPYVTPGSHVGFGLTVLNVSRDKFSGYNFGELILFDDISNLTNGFRRQFPLSRTLDGSSALVSLDSPPGAEFNLENNLIIIVNDILQVPGESYTFDGGTQLQFIDPPKTGSKVVILYFKGSDKDIIESDIIETVKIGDNLVVTEDRTKNLNNQFPRRVYNIPGSKTTDTNVYSNIGLGTDEQVKRVVNWRKQRTDIFINGEKIYKTRPELKSKLSASTRVIKSFSASDTEIFVDYINLFEIDGIKEVNQDLIIRDNRFSDTEQAKLSPTVDNSLISEVSLSNEGSGYYTPPNVSIVSKTPQRKVPGSSWSSSGPGGGDAISFTYEENVTITNDTNIDQFHTIIISSGNTLIIDEGFDFIISGVDILNDPRFEDYKDVAYIPEDKNYVTVGKNGIIGYNAISKLNNVLRPTPTGLFTEDLNSIDYYNDDDLDSPIFVVAGDGILGYSTDKSGPWNRIDKVFPVIVGSISQNTILDPTTKISISDITYNDVKYFDNIGKAIAVGSSMAITGTTGTFGLDWNNVNINSDLNGPEGQILNSIHYYDKQDSGKGGIVKSAGYVVVGNSNYIFKSSNGIKWNTDGTGGLSFKVPDTSLPPEAIGKNFNDLASNGDNLVVVGDDGIIIKATELKSAANNWTYIETNTNEDFVSVVDIGGAYVAITTSGKSYISKIGSSWVENVGDFDQPYRTVEKIELDTVDERLISIGSTSGQKPFIAISTDTQLNASFSLEINSTTGIVTGATIVNAGFGYTPGNPPIIMVAPPIVREEQIANAKVEGDFGNIVSISTSIGINTDHALKFEFEIDPILNSAIYSNFSIPKTGIKTDYYFSISESIFAPISTTFSSFTTGLTTISKSDTFNQIYQATQVIQPDGAVGIVTVISDIGVNNSSTISQIVNELTDNDARPSGISTIFDYSAKYSWGRIYDFIRPTPKSFITFEDMTTTSNIGLSSNPSIHRISNINEKYWNK